MSRQFETKRSVAAAIFTQFPAIYPHRRSSHHPAEVNEDALALQSKRRPEMAAIDGDKLIFLIVKPMPRQNLVRVRDADAFEAGIVEYRPRRVGKILFAKEPIVIERESPPK